MRMSNSDYIYIRKHIQNHIRMKKVLQLAALALVVAGCGCGMSPQERLTVNDKKINEIIAQMTLEEKLGQMNLLIPPTNYVTGDMQNDNVEEKTRMILILHYLEGFSVEEIGKMMALSASAVKMRLKRGREMLQTILAKEDIHV